MKRTQAIRALAEVATKETIVKVCRPSTNLYFFIQNIAYLL